VKTIAKPRSRSSVDEAALNSSPWGPYFSWYSLPAPQVAPGLLGVINQRAAALLHRLESSALGCALWRTRLVEKVDFQIAKLAPYGSPAAAAARLGVVEVGALESGLRVDLHPSAVGDACRVCAACRGLDRWGACEGEARLQGLQER
jgi:hypothetical protein